MYSLLFNVQNELDSLQADVGSDMEGGASIDSRSHTRIELLMSLLLTHEGVGQARLLEYKQTQTLERFVTDIEAFLGCYGDILHRFMSWNEDYD